MEGEDKEVGEAGLRGGVASSRSSKTPGAAAPLTVTVAWRPLRLARHLAWHLTALGWRGGSAAARETKEMKGARKFCGRSVGAEKNGL